MRKKLLAVSALWASLIVAAAVVNHRTPQIEFTLLLMTVCAGASIAILAAPERSCRRPPGA